MSDLTERGGTVYVVDDDASMRDSLSLLLSVRGYRTVCFDSAEALLAAYHQDWTGCVVADLKLPGKSGLELQAELQAQQSRLPVIIITGHGDVPSARAAFKSAALDFLEKPFAKEDLLQAIDKGLQKESARLRRSAAESEEKIKLAGLSQREQEVLALVGKGLHAKEIARALGISSRTVEVHKSNMMTKLGARNLAELVRFALAVEKQSER